MGQGEQARDHFTTATTMYREMDMTYWLETVEAEMRQLGAASGRCAQLVDLAREDHVDEGLQARPHTWARRESPHLDARHPAQAPGGVELHPPACRVRQ